MEGRTAFAVAAEKYVRTDYALNERGVSLRSYRNGTCLNRNGKSPRWGTTENCGAEYLIWSTLTQQIRDRIGNIDDLILQSEPKKGDEKEPTDLELSLEFAFTQKSVFNSYRHLYKDRYFYPDEELLYSRMHAFVVAIFGLKERGHDYQDVFKAIEKVRKRLPLYNFKVGTAAYLSEKLIHLKSVGIEIGIIHGNKHLEKEKKLLMPYVKKQIIHFYVQSSPRRLSYQEITNEVNNEIKKRGYIIISLSTVKLFLSDPEIQNLYKPFRLGKEWVKKFFEPFFVRADPKNVHDKWEMDGTVLPFYFLYNGKITRLWYLIIVDVKSRKIISWGVGLYESRWLILDVYRKAIASCKILAVEIVRDNAGGYDTPEVTELETKLEDKGCLVRPALPGNAKDKGTVEKVNDILNCKHFSELFSEHFIGEPWDSERELYRMDSVEIKELRKKKNVLDFREAVPMMEAVTNKYNAHVF